MRAGCLTFLFLTGCTFLRSSREPLAVSSLVDQKSACVLVLLPGLGDSPELFSKHGFDQAILQSQKPCDVLVVDSHFGYYRDAVLVERLAHEVLTPLRAQYEQTWLVGVSLGGYGAALVAKDRPELVDGVVLISPFLGVPSRVRPVVEALHTAGGLEHYRGAAATSRNPRRHFVEVEPLWNWLAARGRGEEGPRLVLAWGTADAMAWKHRAVSDGLDADQVVSLDGAHTWETFAALFRRVARSPPWAHD